MQSLIWRIEFLYITERGAFSSDVKRGQNFEAEARATRPKPRPKIIMKKVPNND